MKKLMLLWTILTLMAVEVYPQEIKMDPEMTEGEHSYIYCDVGTVSAGVTFFTEPDNIQGSCFGPGAPCSSTLYTISQNTTGALLEIASVDASREEGVWYCQHDTDRSTNTITLNDHTIAGILLDEGWTEPSGPVDTFYAVMTLSCTNKVPNVSFAYEDSESNTGIVPTEAVSMTNQSLYDGTTCENGNKFYKIMLTASNNLDVFNNKQGVKFSFIYSSGKNITAPFSVDFTAFSESTTESPNTTVCVCDGVCTYVGGVFCGLSLGSYIIYTIVIKAVPNKIKVLQVFFVITMTTAGFSFVSGIACTGVTGDRMNSCEGLICDRDLGLSIASLLVGLVIILIKIFIQGMVMDSAGVCKRSLLGNFLHFPSERDAAPNNISTPVVRELVEVRNENSRGDQNQGNNREPPTSGNTNGTRVNGAVGGETEENREGDSDTRTDYVNIPDAGIQPNQTKDGSNDPYINVWNNGQTGNDSPNKENGNEEKEEGSKKKTEESTEHHYESLKKT